MAFCKYDHSLAVQVAEQTLDMYQELQRLRSENEELREHHKKYIELLNADIRHSGAMMGSLLEVCLMPGVGNAPAKHAQSTNIAAQSEDGEMHDH